MREREGTPYQRRLWSHYDQIMRWRLDARRLNEYGLPCPRYHERLERLEQAVLALLQRSYHA